MSTLGGYIRHVHDMYVRVRGFESEGTRRCGGGGGWQSVYSRGEDSTGGRGVKSSSF